jgi:hypothetical protein
MLLRCRRAVVLCAALAALAACDRHVEPFDPAEEPREPDLSRIFPDAAQIAPVTREAPLEPPPPPGLRGAPALAAEAGAPIRGTLRVAPGFEAAVPAGAVLFLVARSGTGGPPVAVKRIDAPRFPLDFELGPDDRMLESVPFAGALWLSARLDGDGNATSRTPGDLQGTLAQPVVPGTSGVEILLDERL